MDLANAAGRRKPGRKPTDPQVIIDALERLLVTTPLRDLKVEDILRAADVSRATFYLHFSTKFDAAVALFAQVTDEVEGAASAYFQHRDGEAPAQALLRGVADSIAVWSRHRDILATVIENERAVPELARQLADIKTKIAQSITAEIELQRSAGAAPDGYDAGELTVALVECTFQLVYRSTIDPDPGRRLDANTIEVITALWCGAVYRIPPPMPTRP